MMRDNGLPDLAYWNDPDDLLKALYSVGREPVYQLQEPLERLLDHPDEDIREETIRILGTRWKLQAIRDRIVHALNHDPAPTVRSAAAVALGASSTKDRRREDTAILVRLLERDGEDLELRRAAYTALLILHRHLQGTGVWPFPSFRKEFDPDRDVDWEWVRSLTASA